MRVAVVDDDPACLELMHDALEDAGWDVVLWSGAQGAVEWITREQPDVVLLDLWMDDAGSGWEILDALTTSSSGTAALPIIICSADSIALCTHKEWLTERGVGILPKPFDLHELYQRLDAATDRLRT